jgi:hypothetical protein
MQQRSSRATPAVLERPFGRHINHAPLEIEAESIA